MFYLNVNLPRYADKMDRKNILNQQIWQVFQILIRKKYKPFQINYILLLSLELFTDVKKEKKSAY